MNTAASHPRPLDPQLAQIVSEHLNSYLDFPEPGILFRDFSPLLASGEPFQRLIRGLAEHYRGYINAVVGLESRGFILSSTLAVELGIPMIMVRKAGKLPGDVIRTSYALEYGTASVEVAPATVNGLDRILVVDDLLATGGTASASLELLEKAGGHVVEIFALMELVDLGGRAALGDTPFQTLLQL